jgi:LmbE family N-acetylglucosaminyl deacetylase
VVVHPDDEILGSAGTIVRHIQNGDEVNVLILAEGITSRGNKEDNFSKELEQLQQTAIKANKLLGVSNIEFGNLPDNRMDSVDLLDIVKIVEKFINTYQPEVIYTHHSGDLNIDHRLTHQAVMTATRPMVNQCVKEIYTFEIPSSTEWSFDYSFKPNVFVDITDMIDFKLQALNCYESEMRKFPHPRSPEAIRVIAQRWGTVVGCEAAEAFYLIRKVIK